LQLIAIYLAVATNEVHFLWLLP